MYGVYPALRFSVPGGEGAGELEPEAALADEGETVDREGCPHLDELDPAAPEAGYDFL